MARVTVPPVQDSQKEHKAQTLGPFLCWAVVFADIGTSIYYVPGILYGTVGKLTGFFVLLTMTVFILLTFKYVEVTYRFPQGGAIVNANTVAYRQRRTRTHMLVSRYPQHQSTPRQVRRIWHMNAELRRS